jgi:hypothetical protein
VTLQPILDLMNEWGTKYQSRNRDGGGPLGPRRRVPLAPDTQFAQHRCQIAAGGGEQVLITRRVLAVAATRNEPGFLQRAQPRCKAGAWGASIADAATKWALVR